MQYTHTKRTDSCTTTDNTLYRPNSRQQVPPLSKFTQFRQTKSKAADREYMGTPQEGYTIVQHTHTKWTDSCTTTDNKLCRPILRQQVPR